MTVAAAAAYGGFSLGALQLALPMAALREVVPCRALVDLPCPAPSVIGGIDLRGVVVPVIDLRLVLGRECTPCEFPTVIVMVFEGRLLGLLADGVTGIFAAAADGVSQVGVADAVASIFQAGVHRPDNQSLVSVLSPAAIAALHQVPMVDDPEPAREHAADAVDGPLAAADPSMPLMLLRCGAVPIAVDAMAVRGTLFDPRVEASALAMGHCRGVIRDNGVAMPAIDLQSLCGLGPMQTHVPPQAFIVALPAGPAAFLVDAVVDVVRALPSDVIHVPGFALPHPTFFGGALPASALPAELSDRMQVAGGQFLLIDAAAMLGCAEVRALSEATGDGVEARHAQTAAESADRCSMITYMLGSEQATPLEQLTEILTYTDDAALPARRGALLGTIVNRGRSIPVLCLARLTGGHGATPVSTVLVVESAGELIGFAVPELKAIEQADWQLPVPDFQPTPAHVSASAPRARNLTLVGSGNGKRMLPVIDLWRLARDAQSERRVA